MATSSVREFLESSTIHGLAHISTAKSRAARAAWVVIVVACFASAIHIITSSYKEWQESPVSTTITTHPITELEFPTVTVCPPRGSNTALNHLMEMVKDVNFTQEERKELLEISKEVFIEIPNKKYAEHMAELLSTESVRSIAMGHASMPEVDKEGTITMRSSEPEGSFSSPGHGDPKYKGDFYSRLQSLHYMLDLPDNMGEMVGEGILAISIETEGNWSFISPENKFQLNQEWLSWSDSEKECASQGGHLASVTSQREQDHIAQLADGDEVWLGGRRKSRADPWQWSDGRSWGFEQTWDMEFYNNPGFNCLTAGESDGMWVNDDCGERFAFVCSNPPTMMSGNHSLVFRKAALIDPKFHIWWINTLESNTIKVPGFKIDWTINNMSP